MAFKLPDLPYGFDALEPVIDAKTMEIHHGKHHGGYVEKLNAAVSGYSELQTKEVEELVKEIDSLPAEIATAVMNNGGGHANHSLFWQVMAPGGKKMPAEMKKMLDRDFGSSSEFREKFTQEALGRFGSGWAWLVIEEGKLHVCSTPNQENPWMRGNVPVLGLDVWEHAYYLQYQNRRAEYVERWWEVVNWEAVWERVVQASSE